MESLILAAEKMFEAKQTIDWDLGLSERVRKLYLQVSTLKNKENWESENVESKNLNSDSQDSQQTSSMLNEDEVNTMFINVFNIICSENDQISINNLEIFSQFISIGLELRRNDEINKVIEIGFQIVDSSQCEPTNHEILMNFYEVWSYAFNSTRNLDSAIKLLREVEQIFWKNFSEILFANVLEWWMKCKQDALAEEILNKYATTVDRNIRSNCTVASTLLRGYAKLGKTDKMIELFKQEFMFDPENKGSYKSIDVSTINVVFECWLKQEMIDYTEMIYSNYLEANQSIPSQTSLVLVKGFCKIRRVDKAVEFWKQLNKLNIHVDEAFYNSLANGCAKNLDNETALNAVSDALLNKIKINTSTFNATWTRE